MNSGEVAYHERASVLQDSAVTLSSYCKHKGIPMHTTQDFIQCGKTACNDMSNGGTACEAFDTLSQAMEASGGDMGYQENVDLRQDPTRRGGAYPIIQDGTNMRNPDNPMAVQRQNTFFHAGAVIMNTKGIDKSSWQCTPAHGSDAHLACRCVDQDKERCALDEEVGAPSTEFYATGHLRPSFSGAFSGKVDKGRPYIQSKKPYGDGPFQH